MKEQTAAQQRKGKNMELNLDALKAVTGGKEFVESLGGDAMIRQKITEALEKGMSFDQFVAENKLNPEAATQMRKFFWP